MSTRSRFFALNATFKVCRVWSPKYWLSISGISHKNINLTFNTLLTWDTALSYLRQFTIFQRLALLVCVVVIGLMLLSVTTLTQQYDSLKNEQHTKTKNLVESAHSILTHFYELQQSSEMSEDQAKKEAPNTSRIPVWISENSMLSASAITVQISSCRCFLRRWRLCGRESWITDQFSRHIL